MTRRRWTLHLGGSYPVIVNGWSLSRVARYERSYVWRMWYGQASYTLLPDDGPALRLARKILREES